MNWYAAVALFFVLSTTAYCESVQCDTKFFKDELFIVVQTPSGERIPYAQVTVTVQYTRNHVTAEDLGNGMFRFKGLTPANGEITVNATVPNLERVTRTLTWVLRDGEYETGNYNAVVTPLTGSEAKPPSQQASKPVAHTTCYPITTCNSVVVTWVQCPAQCTPNPSPVVQICAPQYTTLYYGQPW
jgi:hypothetical protein